MILSDLQRIAVKQAYVAFLKEPTQAAKARAKEIMQDPEAPATAVFVAAHYLLGPMFQVYEPETLWLEIDPCPINRDKLSAAIALALTPSFYWDYRVFGATTHALNNEMVVPETVPRCTAAQMAWAVFEAELLFALADAESTHPEFDESVEAYIAVSLLEDGYVMPPMGLNCCDEELEAKLPAEAHNLRKQVKEAWAALPKDNIENTKFSDDALGAQLLKLVDPWLYVVERTKLLRLYLEKL